MSVLVDSIGAHAAVAGMALLTRGRARYHIYLPDLQIITPKGYFLKNQLKLIEKCPEEATEAKFKSI